MREPFINDQALLTAYSEMLARVNEIDGVTGVDGGFIYEDGKRTEKVSVQVYASDAQANYALAAALPRTIGGVTVSLLPGYFRLHALPGSEPPPAGRDEAHDPIIPGVSVSNHRRKPGTLGLIVEHEAKGRCVLSCAHVLVAPNQNARRVEQPGGAGVNASIAETHCYVADHDGDAAIAVLNGGRGTCPAQYGSGVVIRATRMPQADEIVTKSGLSTGVTCGRVERIGRYLFQRGRDKSFARAGALNLYGMNGFSIVPVETDNSAKRRISAPGDSGSVWYARRDYAGVGLHVGGEISGGTRGKGRAIACYLPVVLARLKVVPAVTSTG